MRVSKQKWLGRRADTGAMNSNLLMALKRQLALRLLDLTDQAAPSDTAGLPTVCRFSENGRPCSAFGFPLSRE